MYAPGNLGAVGVHGRGVVDADDRSRGRQGESQDGDVGGVAAVRYQVNFISATDGRCAGDDTRRGVHAEPGRHAIGIEQSVRVIGSDRVGEGLVEIRGDRQGTGDLGNVARRLAGPAVVNLGNVRRREFDVVHAEIVHLAVPPRAVAVAVGSEVPFVGGAPVATAIGPGSPLDSVHVDAHGARVLVVGHHPVRPATLVVGGNAVLFDAIASPVADVPIYATVAPRVVHI